MLILSHLGWKWRENGRKEHENQALTDYFLYF